MRPPKGIRVSVPLSYEAIEERAAAWRAHLAPAVPVSQAVDALQFFDDLDRQPMVLPDRKLGEVTCEVSSRLPVELEAVTVYSAKRRRVRIILSEQTYAGLERGATRPRFTFFHELGHVILHTPELMRLQKLPHPEQVLARQTRWHRHYEDSEWQANAFAAAFLSPAEGLVSIEAAHHALTVFDVQQTFGVSAEAALRRLDNFTRRRSTLLRAARRGERRGRRA